MNAISTVIITKNEAQNIVACILSAQLVSADIIVVDCGSDDDTFLLATKAGARVMHVDWQCYGHSRNTGALAAANDWILSLDADERVSPQLARTLHTIELDDVSSIYKIRRVNFFGTKKLNFGTPGFETVPRLYHRGHAQWDLFPVHEKLNNEKPARHIKQCILHFGITDLKEHILKKEHYALLSARKYIQQGKKATFIKRFLAPAFNGLKSYIFQAGFLDGKNGWEIALTISYYTWLKYKYLSLLTNHQKGIKEVVMPANTSWK